MTDLTWEERRGIILATGRLRLVGETNTESCRLLLSSVLSLCERPVVL